MYLLIKGLGWSDPISILAACLLLACSAPFAWAEVEIEAETGTEAGEDDLDALLEWRFAAIGRYGSAYPASEKMQFNFIPLPVPIYRGRFLRLFEESDKPVRGIIFERDRIKLGLDLDMTFPSDSDKIDARNGMPDLDLLVQAGPELDLQFVRDKFLKGSWHLALQARGAVSFDGLNPSYRGLTFSTEFRYIVQVSDRDEFKFRITPTFATSQYMQYYYQVGPQFVTSERTAYDAKGGYLGTDLTLNWKRDYTDKLSVWYGAQLSIFTGASNTDSPLFTQEVTPSIFVAFMYKFWESKKRAQRPGQKKE